MNCMTSTARSVAFEKEALFSDSCRHISLPSHALNFISRINDFTQTHAR